MMTGSDTINNVFAALSEPRRRTVLQYFLARGVETASYEELLETLLATDGPPADRSRAEIHLRHTDLPALEQCELIEYEDRSEMVRYRGDPIVEETLDDTVDLARSR